MQVLYAMKADPVLKKSDIVKRYWQIIYWNFDLLLFNLYLILKILEVAEEDEQKRKAKHLPSDDDREFSAKIYHNELIQSLVNNKGLQSIFQSKKFEEHLDKDLARKIYFSFNTSEEYKKYMSEGNSRDSHLAILLEFFRHCRKNEMYNEILKDYSMVWTDDKSLIIGSLKKIFKSLPIEGIGFLDQYKSDDETIKDFGLKLLEVTLDRQSEIIEEIGSLLENWEPDRLAIIDMILLKMAGVELLEFPSIPPKVTINEYVEIAKMYSTEKSREFVNGLLDQLMKKYKNEGKLNKEGRGLLD